MTAAGFAAGSTADDGTQPTQRGHFERAARTYRCCIHCQDDVVHDVPKDGHDLPCDLCVRGTTRADAEQIVAAWLAKEYGELLNRNPADDPPGYWEFQARELLTVLAEADQ